MIVTEKDIAVFKDAFYRNTADETADPVQLGLEAVFAVRTALDDDSYQMRALGWAIKCFGFELATSRTQRRNRFLEEALELVQACGGTREDVHALADHVFARPVGEQFQEAGGTMLTLALLLSVNFIDIDSAAEDELRRVWAKIDKIKAKEAARAPGSVLPGKVAAA